MTEAALHDGIARLRHDVAATVGEEHAWLVREEVRRLWGFIEVTDAYFLQRLIDDVQQRLHDEFIDTTWPACPDHQNHPMWFKDGWWWCPTADVRVVGLGSLGLG